MRFQILIKLLAILLSFTSAYTWTTKDECPQKIETIVSSDPCADGMRYLCTDKPQFTNMNAVHDALTHCPNMTALDLRVTNSGCTEAPSRWNFPISPWGGDRYANLKSLRLEGYDFSERPILGRQPYRFPRKNAVAEWAHKAVAAMSTKKLGQIFLSHSPFKTNLELWLDAMDWSGVEELMIPVTDEVFKKLPPKLNSLQRLETTNLSFIEALPNNTLTHLTWMGNSDTHDLPSILERQGATLQNLHFRRPERSMYQFLPDFNVSILPGLARNLTHISLNVPRNGTWPLDTLSVIASLPQLQTADIYMNIQSECSRQRPRPGELSYWGMIRWEEANCNGEEQYQQPAMSKQGAEDMFRHMREVKKGVGLRNVTFFVGDWTRPWDGPLYFPDWLDERREKVACRVDNGGDDGWCIVERDRDAHDKFEDDD